MDSIKDSDLMSAFSNAGFGYWGWEVKTKKAVFSDSWKMLRGADVTSDFKLEESIKFVHPDDRDSLCNDRAMLISGGNENHCIDYRVKHADGSWIWIEERAHVTRDISGNLLHVIGCEIDITERKFANQVRAQKSPLPSDKNRIEKKNAITEAEALNKRLTRLLEISGIGVWQWSFKEEKLIWDDRMLEIHGLDRSEFRGKHSDWSDRVHPNDIEHAVVESSQKIHDHETALDFRIVRPNGDIRHIYSSFYPETDDDGELIRITGINVDITERRRTELALLEARHHITRIANNVPGMIYRHLFPLSPGQPGTFLNSRCEEMFGVSHEDASRDLTLMYQWINPDDLTCLHRRLKACLNTLEPLSCEYRVNHPNKGLRWYKTYGQPERLDNGSIALDGFVLDITKQKNAELELQKTNNELTLATRVKGEFLATMSHEIRTPLSAVVSTSEALAEGSYGPISEKQLAGIEIIQQSGFHLLELINEVLDLSKIESGALALQIAPTNIKRICHASIQLLCKEAEKKDIDLKLDIPYELPDYKADEKRLRQVIVNLLGNAIKFTPNRGKVSLAVEKFDENSTGSMDKLRISVSDTGIGIASSDLERMFEPFVQADSSLSRQYNGVGLGLSLVKRFVELHSGTVGVVSEKGVGSCFTIDLSLKKADKADADMSPHDAVSQTLLDQSRNRDADHQPLVLLAEDNHLLAETTINYLRECNFRVQLVHNGQEAIETARRDPVDIILMDIQMPKVDGIEAIRQIRKIPNHKDTPIIALTGLAMPNDADLCLGAGANMYLSKPFSVKRLVNLIDDKLSSRSIA